MGWSYTHRDKGISDKEFFSREFGYGPGRDEEIIFSSTIRRSVFYAAVRNNKTGQVWALVNLIHQAPKDFYNFGHKAMDETVMPYAFDAPAKLLDLLTPTDSEYANEWRAKCRQVIAAKKAAPKVTPGTTIKTSTSMSFGNGGITEDTFTYVGRRSVFRTTGGTLVRLPANWRTMSFELV